MTIFWHGLLYNLTWLASSRRPVRWRVEHKTAREKKITVSSAVFRAALKNLTERLEEANVVPRAFVTVPLDKSNEGSVNEIGKRLYMT